MRAIACLVAPARGTWPAAWLLGCITLSASPAFADQQQLVFGPTVAWASTVDGDTRWLIRVQGRVFKPAEASRKRQLAIDALAIKVPANRRDPLYRARAAYFVSDSESNVRVAIAIGDAVRTLPPSDSAGCFSADIELSTDEATRLARDGRITFEALPGPHRPAHVTGTAVRVAPEGVIVVTDVDDTIKHTDIPHPAEARANTFVRPFEPVPDMPELYRSWQATGGERVHFHVVSAGPWQFHSPLQRFTVDAGFPAFTWNMRCVDVTNPFVLVEETLMADPARLSRFKVETIRALMLRWPQRRFVLVGDSGERDPEAYAQVVAEFGDRVDAVYIRNVSGEGTGAQRYVDLFEPLSAMGRLQVFERADALPRRLNLDR